MTENTIRSRDNNQSLIHTDELLSHNQANQYADYGQSEGEMFLNQYTNIQYEDFTSLVSSLEYLNIDHLNVE